MAYDRFAMSGYVIRDSDEIIRTYTTDKVQLSHANSASFHHGSRAAGAERIGTTLLAGLIPAWRSDSA